MQINILIVDDDPVQRRLLDGTLNRFGYQVTLAEGGEEALDMVAQAEQPFSLIILDLVMPDLDGMGVMERLARLEVTTPVIVQTSQGGVDTVVSAMRAGACDFIVKPASPERLQVSIENALKITTLETELKRMKRSVSGALTFDDVISNAERMTRVIDLGKRAAGSSIPILLEGESGVGKEMIARAIQGTSTRAERPFVTVNCGAIPENLVESILFGHEKGAFTGATEKKRGKFLEADGGTLFLDEIGELPLDVQVKLLRAVQEGEIDPVGGKAPIKVDIRIISATNRSLMDMVQQGTFREDLYYRLNVFPIWIPPLRERHADIARLAHHFTARFAAEEGRRHVKGVTPEAIHLLERYDWPGNIRQLENAVFRAVVLCDGPALTPTEFPQIVIATDTGRDLALPPTYTAPGPAPFNATLSNFDINDPNIIGLSETNAIYQQSEEAQDALMEIMDISENIKPLVELEADIIKRAYTHYNGRMSEIARRLGIGRSTLYRKMKEYGIINSDQDEAPERHVS